MQPSRLSDSVVIESEVAELCKSSFCVRHRLFNGGELAVECFAIMVWTALSEADPDKIESKPISRGAPA